MYRTYVNDRSQQQRKAADAVVGEIVVGGSSAAGLLVGMPTSYEHLYRNPNAPHWALNELKGSIGEELMDRIITKEFLQGTGNWTSIPPRTGPQGLDGLFIRADSQGRLLNPLVVESKYGTSQLGSTDDGRQMSEPWIRSRIAEPADTYRTLAGSEQNKIIRRSFIPDDVNADRIPLSNTEKAAVWTDEAGRLNYYVPEAWSLAEVQSQSKQISNVLDATSEGKLDYRARLFNYRVANGEHEITLTALSEDGTIAVDSDGSVIQEVIQGPAEELPGPVRNSLHQVFQLNLEQNGLDPSAADSLADRLVENPEFIDELGLTPKEGFLSFGEGIFAGVGTATAGGIMAMGVFGAQQYLRGGKINWDQLSTFATLGGASAGAAYVTGAAVHHTLIETEIGQHISTMMPLEQIAGQSIEQVLGTVGGSLIGSFAFIAGIGLTQDFNSRQMIRLLSRSVVRTLTASGAYAGAMSGAAALGTASTGTAISSLSGAAAQKAALAWWGGGSLASGGFGTAGGFVVLTSMGAVVGIGAFIAAGYAFNMMDQAEQRTSIKARLNLVQERVSDGIQPEWA